VRVSPVLRLLVESRYTFAFFNDYHYASGLQYAPMRIGITWAR
jgi:hypothetical protein